MKTSQITLKKIITTLLLMFILLNPGKTQVNLLTEGWETASIGQTPPSGWGVDLVNGSNYTYFKQVGTNPSCYPYSGNRMVEYQSATVYGAQNRLKRITPVSTVGYSVVNVDFRWFTSVGGIYQPTDCVSVQWSTSGTTWTYAGTYYVSSQNDN
jgi:hypothetical protein